MGNAEWEHESEEKRYMRDWGGLALTNKPHYHFHPPCPDPALTYSTHPIHNCQPFWLNPCIIFLNYLLSFLSNSGALGPYLSSDKTQKAVLRLIIIVIGVTIIIVISKLVHGFNTGDFSYQNRSLGRTTSTHENTVKPSAFCFPFQD